MTLTGTVVETTRECAEWTTAVPLRRVTWLRCDCECITQPAVQSGRTCPVQCEQTTCKLQTPASCALGRTSRVLCRAGAHSNPHEHAHMQQYQTL